MISVVIYLTNLQWELIKYQPLGMLIPTPASNTPEELPDIHLLKDPINKYSWHFCPSNDHHESFMDLQSDMSSCSSEQIRGPLIFKGVFDLFFLKKMGWLIFKCILKLYFKVSFPEEEKPSLPGGSQRMSGVIHGMGEIWGKLKEKRKPDLLSWQSRPSFLVARHPVWMK